MGILKKSDLWSIGVSKVGCSEYGASRLRSTTHIPLDDPNTDVERSDAVSGVEPVETGKTSFTVPSLNHYN